MDDDGFFPGGARDWRIVLVVSREASMRNAVEEAPFGRWRRYERGKKGVGDCRLTLFRVTVVGLPEKKTRMGAQGRKGQTARRA